MISLPPLFVGVIVGAALVYGQAKVATVALILTGRGSGGGVAFYHIAITRLVEVAFAILAGTARATLWASVKIHWLCPFCWRAAAHSGHES
jgi:hypothetical protein